MGKLNVPPAELAGGIADNPNQGTTGTPPGGPSISAETISVHASGGRFRFDAHVFSHVRILADKITGSATTVTLAWCATYGGSYTTVLTFTLASDPASASVVLPLSVMGDVYWSLTADDGATTWKMFAAQFLPLAGTRLPPITGCDSMLSSFAIPTLSIDLCGMTSTADLTGIGVSSGCDDPIFSGLSFVSDPTAFNGTSVLRVPAGAFIQIPFPTTLRKQWVRLRVRMAASFGDGVTFNTYTFALRDDPSARAGPYLGLYYDHSESDFTGWTSPDAIHSGGLNATLNDGSWWDVVIARLQGGGSTGSYTGRIYVAPSAGGTAASDITDSSQNYDDTQGGDCGGNSILRVLGPIGGHIDLGSIETVDGDLHANPFGLP